VTGPQHLAASGVVGLGLWAATGDLITVPVAIAAGVLPDIDHLLDYYNRYIRRDWRRIFLLLHGWEYLALALGLYFFVFREPWMLAVALGYMTQIGGDQLFNGGRWFSYLLFGRALNGFRASRVLPDEHPDSYEAFVRSVPFARARIRRWFEERATPKFK
jgi:hypothetical protein